MHHAIPTWCWNGYEINGTFPVRGAVAISVAAVLQRLPERALLDTHFDTSISPAPRGHLIVGLERVSFLHH